MCEKEITIEALREKVAIVSKERDALRKEADLYYDLWGHERKVRKKADMETRKWKFAFTAAAGLSAVLFLLWILM